MTLTAHTQIGAQKPLYPDSEQSDNNYVKRNRRLYNGDFTELRLERIDLDTPTLQFNWFRRVTDFYPEFMLAERPNVEIEGNPGMTEAFLDMSRQFFNELTSANKEMIRSGQGILASHPMDPLSFTMFHRDEHFEVINNQGVITHDLLISIRGYGDKRTIDIITYGIDGRDNAWRQYAYNSGTVGDLIDTFDMAPRIGRQVVTLDDNDERVSVYDDIKQPLAQMARTPTQVARITKRNSNPHLFGPETMLITDANGNVTLNPEGMFLPMQPDDPTPGYPFYDSRIEAASWLYQEAQQNMLNMAGLSIVLFDPDLNLGNLSGRAVERTLIPFTSKVSARARINEEAITDVLNIWNANRSVNGEEVFQYDESDVIVEWKYGEVFQDEQPTEQPEESNEGTDPSSDSGSVSESGSSSS